MLKDFTYLLCSRCCSPQVILACTEETRCWLCAARGKRIFVLWQFRRATADCTFEPPGDLLIHPPRGAGAQTVGCDFE